MAVILAVKTSASNRRTVPNRRHGMSQRSPECLPCPPVLNRRARCDLSCPVSQAISRSAGKPRGHILVHGRVRAGMVARRKAECRLLASEGIPWRSSRASHEAWRRFLRRVNGIATSSTPAVLKLKQSRTSQRHVDEMMEKGYLPIVDSGERSVGSWGVRHRRV